MSYLDVLLANAADCLLRAMTSAPGSADETRYLRAVQVFMTRAEQVQGGAA